MQVRAYIENDIIRTYQGFKVIHQTYKGEQYDEHRLDGDKVYPDGGRWYVDLDSPSASVPGRLGDLVTEYTSMESVPLAPKREYGVYELGGAKAEVDLKTPTSTLPVTITVWAKSVEELLALRSAIRAGSIRPTESYEGAQLGMSRAELERACETAERDAAIRSNLLWLYGALHRSKTPFVGRKNVIAMVTKALRAELAS